MMKALRSVVSVLRHRGHFSLSHEDDGCLLEIANAELKTVQEKKHLTGLQKAQVTQDCLSEHRPHCTSGDLFARA